MVNHTRNSCSAFNPSKVHTTHTHTHTRSSGQPFMLRRPGSSGIEGGESAVHSLPSTTISAGPGLELTTTFGLRIRHSNQPLGHDFPYVMICRWVNLQDCFYVCLVSLSLFWCLIRWTAPWTQRRVSVLESMGIPALNLPQWRGSWILWWPPNSRLMFLCPCMHTVPFKRQICHNINYFCKGKSWIFCSHYSSIQCHTTLQK